jgi:hypothetical protein
MAPRISQSASAAAHSGPGCRSLYRWWFRRPSVQLQNGSPTGESLRLFAPCSPDRRRRTQKRDGEGRLPDSLPPLSHRVGRPGRAELGMHMLPRRPLGRGTGNTCRRPGTDRATLAREIDACGLSLTLQTPPFDARTPANRQLPQSARADSPETDNKCSPRAPPVSRSIIAIGAPRG